MINSHKQPFGFTLETTQDGSPTLRLPDSGESMHHSGGAAAETIYIYGDVINQAHQKWGSSCKTCIVGLGLGYIEIAWALSLIQRNLTPSTELSFHSFEIVGELKEQFIDWVNADETNLIYDTIVEKMNPSVSALQIKKVLRRALANGSALEGDVAEFTNEKQKWNVICYDAFSHKTNEGLWAAEFLNSFLKKFTAAECVFTTYACTGVLRKTLIENGFTFTKRPGFSGKRDSSFAKRGLINQAVI